MLSTALYLVASLVIAALPILAAKAAVWAWRRLRERRKERAWAATVARNVRERADFEAWARELGEDDWIEWMFGSDEEAEDRP